MDGPFQKYCDIKFLFISFQPQVSAGRAVRRFSSFAVGPKKGPSPMRAKPNQPFLNIPTLSNAIVEEEEEEEERGENTNIFKETDDGGSPLLISTVLITL